MKKSLLLIFLAAIVLAGCANKQQPTEKQNDNFNRNIDCQKYKKDGETIIFYSPSKNSCIYGLVVVTTSGDSFTEVADALNNTIYFQEATNANGATRILRTQYTGLSYNEILQILEK